MWEAVAATGIFILGDVAQGGLGTEVHYGVQVRSPSRGRSPPEAEAVCRHCLQILTTETIKILKISHHSPLDS